MGTRFTQDAMPDDTSSIQGPHFMNCNCEYGCPCQFWGRPTDGTCRAVLAWRIDEGHYGDVRLDGLFAINTYAWPGAIHEGNGSSSPTRTLMSSTIA